MILDGDTLTLETLTEMARSPDIKVEINSEIEERVRASRTLLDGFVESGRIIYGVTTAVGGFVNWLVPPKYAEEQQNNILRAVATNVGPDLDDEYVRASMLARINSLGRGASAISFDNYKKYVDMYNAGILPCIPEKGSLGASGDLGPLAYIALVGTGAWRAKYQGEIMPGGEALAKAGLEPMKLGYKEGLALINGTSTMVGVASCVAIDAKRLIKSYLLISSMSIEALKGKIMPFHPAAHENKPHVGQRLAADCIFTTVEHSNMAVKDAEVEAWLAELKNDEPQGLDQPIEDTYTVRATPQVLGPVIDTTLYVSGTVQDELNSTNDNPLVLTKYNEAFHNANFHGQYMANAMDQMSIALTTMCNLSDRRTDRFLDPDHNNGLPPFLCKEDPGLRCGLMGGQFCAASLTAENRSLCHPVSIQTLTTTGDFQDHVSMGLIAARRARDILTNTYYILAFELICAAQAADQRGVEDLSPITAKAHKIVRETVPYLDHDEPLTDHLEAVAALIKAGKLLDALPADDTHFTW